MRLDYILSFALLFNLRSCYGFFKKNRRFRNSKKKKGEANQLLVDELHTHKVLGCGLPIYFRISISILPYHESLPVPQTVLPRLFGWNCFRAFPSIWWFLAEGSPPLTGPNRSLLYFSTSYPSQYCLSLTYHNSSDIFTTIQIISLATWIFFIPT